VARAHGWTGAGKGRVPLMLIALLDVLRTFPGQIPDVDAMLQITDTPCVPRCGVQTRRAGTAVSLPCSRKRSFSSVVEKMSGKSSCPSFVAVRTRDWTRETAVFYCSATHTLSLMAINQIVACAPGWGKRCTNKCMRAMLERISSSD
jgi:Glycosyl transferase family 90